MKRIILFLAGIMTAGLILNGCNKENIEATEEEFSVYSFYGENELFNISNGVIVLSSEEEIFDGGILRVNEDKKVEISSYSITFYIMSGNDKSVLMSNAVHDMTGGSVSMEGEIGKMSGEDFIARRKNVELKDNLYCELKITSLDGIQNEYQIPLMLEEVTESRSN